MQASQIILGCMRIIELGKNPVKVIETAYENGINFLITRIFMVLDSVKRFCRGFGANLYSTGRHLSPIEMRYPSRIAFDFSKEHIIQSVEGSLQRLQTDYLDTMLLHRPDTLMEPEEVAEAFYELEKSGKVRYFGVSNQNPMQVELLKTAVKQPLLFNQLQFGLKHTEMVDAGLNVNIPNQASHMQDGSVLEYSRINKMTIQAWSPFQHGYFDGPFVGNDKFPELNKKLEEYAEKYNLTPSGIAIAWINRHPARMQTIIGTMTERRIEEVTNASDLVLSRDEWYDLYMAAGNILP